MTSIAAVSLPVRAAWALALAGAAAAQAAPATYRIADLGAVQTPLPTAVAAMDDAGRVAVNVLQGDAVVCAVLDHGAVTVLPTLGGASCFARGINDAGVVVGSSVIGDGSGAVHGFAWALGKMVDLGTDPGYPDSEAVGINALGSIVSNSFDAMQEKAFVYKHGTPRAVGEPADAVQVAAQAIDRAGDVTGTAEYISGHAHAFLWSRGVATDLGTLGSLPNGDSAGLAINDKAQVVGWSSGAGFRRHAMIVASGRMRDLGVLPKGDPYATSEATGIDAHGRVVGTSDDGAGTTVAFLHQGGGMFDLNTLLDPADAAAWQLVSAHSINRVGQIAGMAVSRIDGSSHVFLATPTTPAR